MASKKAGSISHPEIKGLCTLAASLFLFLSLGSFVRGAPYSNWFGIVGYGVALGWFYTFGICAYLIASWVGWTGWKLLMSTLPSGWGMKTVHFFSFISSLCILLNVVAEHCSPFSPFIQEHLFSEISLLTRPFVHRVVRCNLGGVPFYYLYRDLPLFNLQHMLSDVGVTITFCLTALMALILCTDTRLVVLGERIKGGLAGIWRFCCSVYRDVKPLRASFTVPSGFFPAKKKREVSRLPFEMKPLPAPPLEVEGKEGEDKESGAESE